MSVKIKHFTRAKETQFSIESNIRSYTYTVVCSSKTGNVQHITAGCRSWETFAAARAHYDGQGTSRKWERVYKLETDLAASTKCSLHTVWKGLIISYAFRCEAMGILSKLRYRSEKYFSERKAKQPRAPSMKRRVK